MKQTTRTELQELQDAGDSYISEPLILNTSAEPLNAMSLQTNRNPIENSMFCSHFGSGCNLVWRNPNKSSHLFGRVFVLDVRGKPLTPCKPFRARKLIEQGKAIPKWNKLGQFGIQMLNVTGDITPETILGIDNGTKFEGESIISKKENILNVMWLLPDKKKLVKKLEDRRKLRRARRWRNCRRRPSRFDNRSREGFIAPSQFMMVQSRLKAIKEFFNCYPISKVAIEDTKFNHRDKHYGKNFSTMEIGKNIIKTFIIEKVGRDGYYPFEGFETQEIREKNNLKKSSNKSLETFNSHCVDSFSIANELSSNKVNPNYNLLVVDDTYRPTRRKLYKTEPANGIKLKRIKKQIQKGKFRGITKDGGFRERESNGNFHKIKKGIICNLGLIGGGTEPNTVYIYPMEKEINKKNRIGRTINKIDWMSHKFKTKLIEVTK